MNQQKPIEISKDRALWLASCALFVAGIILPMFTFHKFLFFDDTFSLLGSILHLVRVGELFLFAVIFSFSIIGPVYKLYIIHVLIAAKRINAEDRIKLVRRLALIGKWSMADVFVLAILVSTVKLGIIASVSIHVGLVFFGLAVLSSMLLVQKQLSGYELRPVSENA